MFSLASLSSTPLLSDYVVVVVVVVVVPLLLLPPTCFVGVLPVLEYGTTVIGPRYTPFSPASLTHSSFRRCPPQFCCGRFLSLRLNFFVFRYLFLPSSVFLFIQFSVFCILISPQTCHPLTLCSPQHLFCICFGFIYLFFLSRHSLSLGFASPLTST